MISKKYYLILFAIIFFEGLSEKKIWSEENVEKETEKELFIGQNEFSKITKNGLQRNCCLDLRQLFLKHNVKGLSINSKTVHKNDAFFAIKGRTTDGNNFIADALEKGAVLAITENKTTTETNPHKIIYVKNVQKTLHEAIEIFHPKKPKTLIAVTGTNGKSSVVSYIAQLYSLLEKKSASVGTLGVEIFGSDCSITDVPALTTLDYLSFRKISHNLAQNGVEYLAFEASSHGLDQGRLEDTEVTIGCFTSFGQEHLDYHRTKENYLSAKLKLFDKNLLKGGLAVLNSQIEEIEFIKEYLNKRSIKYLTVGTKGDLQITEINSSLKSQSINFTFNNKEYFFSTSIIGRFQAGNLLIAALSVNHTGFDFDRVTHLLAKIKPVKGRMSRIEDTNIFIDYCHTPDAIEKVLQELKSIKLRDGKLIMIFGCGGNRDKTKRSIIGRIAAKLADKVIITDDNPRFEDPKLIRDEIIRGIGDGNFIVIADREEAIKYAMNNLKQDDILLIAGKGHENYQIIGDEKIPFCETEIVKKCIFQF